MSETPESKPRGLVAADAKALSIAERRTQIANRALNEFEYRRYIDLFVTHPEAGDAFVKMVGRLYPCSAVLIQRYAERLLWSWDWGFPGLSQNDSLPWSEELIERYAERWDWEGEGLSGNEGLPWNESFLRRYAQRWEWPCVAWAGLPKLLGQWAEPQICAVMDSLESPSA